MAGSAEGRCGAPALARRVLRGVELGLHAPRILRVRRLGCVHVHRRGARARGGGLRRRVLRRLAAAGLADGDAGGIVVLECARCATLQLHSGVAAFAP